MFIKIKNYLPLIFILYFLLLITNFYLYLEEGKTNYLKLLTPPIPLYETYDEVSNILESNQSASISFVIRGYQRPPIYALSHLSFASIIFEGPTKGIKSYKSDRFGFNNPDQVYEQAENRIILMGDSIVHGYHVNEGNDIASHMRKLGHNTINLGQGGNGPIQNLAILREYTKHLNPNTIFWFFYSNDLIDLERQVSQHDKYIYNNYVNNETFSQNLINRQDEIDSFWRRYDKKYYDDLSGKIKSDSKENDVSLKSNLDIFISFFTLKKLRNSLFKTDERLSQNSKIILDKGLIKKYFEICNLAREQSGLSNEKFVFVMNRNQKQKNMSEFDLFLEKEIYKFLENNNYTYLNLDEIYENNGNEIFPYHDGFREHPNSLGYKLISDQINNFIKLSN